MVSAQETRVEVECRELRPLSLVRVSQRDWDRLSQKCRALPLPSLGRPTWLSLFSGAVFATVSIGVTVSLSSVPQSIAMPVYIVTGGFFLASVVGVVWHAVALYSERKSTTASRLDVLDEIQFIEESWAPACSEGGTPVPQVPTVGSLSPGHGSIVWDQPVTFEFTGGHTAGYRRIRWVRLFLGPSERWNENWSSQVYLSINPEGVLNLWDSSRKPHKAQLPSQGILETDMASIDLDQSELSCEGETLRLRLCIRLRIRGTVHAYLTTTSNPDLTQTGIVHVGQFQVR